MPINTATVVRAAMKRLEGRKTQAQVAEEAGFPRANMVSMIKTGKARLPIERIPALAEALEIDPALLFRLVLAENWPGYERVVIRIFGDTLTTNERELVRFIRHITGDEVPKLNPTLERAIRSVFKAAS